MTFDAREMLATILDVPPDTIRDDAALGAHLRWDSLAQLRVMLELERRFGVEMTAETVRRYGSLAGLVTLQCS